MIKYVDGDKSSDWCCFIVQNRTYILFEGLCRSYGTDDLIWVYGDGFSEFHTKKEWTLDIFFIMKMYIELWSDTVLLTFSDKP